MRHFRTAVGVAILVLGSSAGALAQHHEHSASVAKGAPAQASDTEGEIRRIDKATGKLTIKHGPIKNLGMPPMTMAFKVNEPAALEKLKPGDKVHFVADEVKGVLTVMSIEAVK